MRHTPPTSSCCCATLTVTENTWAAGSPSPAPAAHQVFLCLQYESSHIRCMFDIFLNSKPNGTSWWFQFNLVEHNNNKIKSRFVSLDLSKAVLSFIIHYCFASYFCLTLASRANKYSLLHQSRMCICGISSTHKIHISAYISRIWVQLRMNTFLASPVSYQTLHLLSGTSPNTRRCFFLCHIEM